MMTWLALAALLLAGDPLPKAGEIRPKVVFQELGEHKVSSADRRRFNWKYKLPQLDLEQESFTVIVPKGYNGKQPFGLFVYISPGPQGLMVSRRLHLEQLRELLEQHRLLYVGANQSGNERNPLDRLQLALTGAHNMGQNYQVDRQRVVVGGFSGGGKMASIAGRYAPDQFTGVVAIAGPVFHRLVAAAPGKYYPADMTLPPALEKSVIQKVSFAFLTGPQDFNYEPSIRIEQAYRTSGYRTLLVDVPGLTHEIPGAADLTQAIRFVLREKEPPGERTAKVGRSDTVPGSR